MLSFMLCVVIVLCLACRARSLSCEHFLGEAKLNVRLDNWGDDTVRVRISPSELILVPDPQALTAQPPSHQMNARVSRQGSECTIHREAGLMAVNGNLRIEIDANGLIAASRNDDASMLFKSTGLSFDPYQIQSTVYNGTYSSYWTVIWNFTQAPGYTYGLGEHHHGRERLRYSNYSINDTFSQTAAYKGDITIPWQLHTSGFAVLWNQPGWLSWSISADSAENVSWSSNMVPQFDVLISVAPASKREERPQPYAALIRNLLTATDSFPAQLPHYASGFWQCKLRYRSQKEVMDAVRGFRERDLPISVIVIDYMNWKNLGDFGFNEDCFPDPSSMVSELREMGIELMVSMWPHAGALSSNFPYMLENGFLTHNSSGEFLNYTIPWLTWPPGPQPPASAVDFVAPGAQQYIAELLTDNYIKHGIKMFWLDAIEPDCAPTGQQFWNGRPDVEISSVYPLSVIQTVCAALDSAGFDDGMMLARDTWIGGNKLRAAVWSGDIESTFAELRRQILVSQNVAMSGIYHWTTDVGGFFDGDAADPVFQQLMVRWFQFGVFCPIFRTHGSRNPGLPSNECGNAGYPTEIWYYEHYPILRKLLLLRETIRPYVEHHLNEASRTGVPLLRPMFFDYADPNCYEAEDQYMFGPDWLVAPILSYNATERLVYLPALDKDHEWQHFYTGRICESSQWHRVTTTLEDFPLFQRVAHQTGIESE